MNEAKNVLTPKEIFWLFFQCSDSWTTNDVFCNGIKMSSKAISTFIRENNKYRNN